MKSIYEQKQDIDRQIEDLYRQRNELDRKLSAKALAEKTDELREIIRKASENAEQVFPQHASVACQGVEGAYSDSCGEVIQISGNNVLLQLRGSIQIHRKRTL